jgi:branched-chain amino acid transport system ATP-binding protein
MGTAATTTSAQAPLLQAQDLHAGYGSAQVLQGVSLQLQAGEVVGLLGRNGMGKTTLVRTLMGALKPTAGSVQVLGQPMMGLQPHAIARLGLALVPEGRQVFSNLSVEEHFSAFVRPGVGAAAVVWSPAKVFELFPRLAERRHHLGHQLSGGEQQMLAIGRALVTNPRLLILDEATEGLAPLIREEIWRALALLRQQGQTILVIDKYVQRLITLADRHLILEKGVVVWTGTSAELQADRSLWQRYLGV